MPFQVIRAPRGRRPAATQTDTSTQLRAQRRGRRVRAGHARGPLLCGVHERSADQQRRTVRRRLLRPVDRVRGGRGHAADGPRNVGPGARELRRCPRD